MPEADPPLAENRPFRSGSRLHFVSVGQAGPSQFGSGIFKQSSSCRIPSVHGAAFALTRSRDYNMPVLFLIEPMKHRLFFTVAALAVFLLPVAAGASTYDSALATRMHGRILLQVEEHGEAWYVLPRTLSGIT